MDQNETTQNPFPAGSPFANATVGRVINDADKPFTTGTGQVITDDKDK